ncbi:MAG: hypothetical protein WB502_12810 [Thermoactinomyces sp.]
MIKNIYIYLVLFATLMMTIGGSVGAFMAIADLISPVPYYQTFEQYRQFSQEKQSVGSNGQKAALSEQELRKQYDDMIAAERDRQVSQAKNSLIKSLGWIIIPLPVFVYYQRRLVNKK